MLSTRNTKFSESCFQNVSSNLSFMTLILLRITVPGNADHDIY